MKWKALQKGDWVDLIAPGYPTEIEKVQKGIDQLLSWDLRVHFPQDLIEPFYFHAQTDEKRLEFVKKAILSKQSAAIWSVRGGYGSNRLIPSLLRIKNPKVKLFVGISDVTSLHLLMNQKWKWSSLHGALLERLGSGTLPADLLEETRALVFGELDEIQYPGLTPLNSKASKKSKVEGRLIGGNLTVIQTALATDLHPKTKGQLLFFEDVGERGYRVDRMLEQFRQAGLFDHCAGVVFGSFTVADEPGLPGESYVPFALERFAETVSVPVWSGLPAGHGEKVRPLPLGTRAYVHKQTLFVEGGFQ